MAVFRKKPTRIRTTKPVRILTTPLPSGKPRTGRFKISIPTGEVRMTRPAFAKKLKSAKSRQEKLKLRFDLLQAKQRARKRLV